MIEELFLEALKAALKNERVFWDMDIQPDAWRKLFQIADKHQVLPMIYEAVYDCPSAQRIDPRFFEPYKRRMMQSVMMQTVKTSEFLNLYRFLSEKDLKPLVIKGIICRELYPNPDYRMSSDEDLLIMPGQFEEFHKAMMEYGMRLSDSEMNIWDVYEVPYGKPGRPIYIELHKYLFPPDSSAYGDLNRFFEDVFERAESVPIQNCDILTMNATDHLFYLICHAFKHFLHSGFGIRQICDIILFANTHGDAIDWKMIFGRCQMIHADLFTAAVFKIGQKYLVFDPGQACYPDEWKDIAVDESDMLYDLLDGGIFGDSDMSRKHSSTITLNAVTDDKKGKRSRISILRSVFPSAKSLEGRYSYLKKRAYLLPIAWVDRIVHYGTELKKNTKDSAADAVRIGGQRVELMKKYGIIKQ
ncbi:MAG: nucleotidyltransferase family protein [Lachnospiraceae bacterium]|nr:nucleotidyltransferase family protein [Lachnospiraceae bacterium]